MKYRVIKKNLIDDFARYNWNKYTIKEMIEIMENEGLVTTFNNMRDAKNFICKAIKARNAYLIYRYWKHYGTYVIESKKLIKVF